MFRFIFAKRVNLGRLKASLTSGAKGKEEEKERGEERKEKKEETPPPRSSFSFLLSRPPSTAALNRLIPSLLSLAHRGKYGI